MPKYEKVDEYTVRVIREQGANVTLSQLLENKESLLKQQKQLNASLDKLEEIIKEAEKLGIKETIKEVSCEIRQSMQGEPETIKLGESNKSKKDPNPKK